MPLFAIEVAVSLIAAVLLFMSVVFALQISVGTWHSPKQTGRKPSGALPPVAVLVPAHNEENSLDVSLASIKQQLRERDRLMVVADNCTDQTARVAGRHGADVVERTDAANRGKGYALQFGIDQLRDDPRPIVIIIDADCTLAPGSIKTLCSTVESTGRPVQSLNLIELGSAPSLQERLGVFAFRVKNYARFKGLQRLGFACPLAGTGMAFPWAIIKNVKLASGNIVEDLNLGIDLAIDGHPAVFEDRAMVTSHFPDKQSDQLTQRRRWEHGHIQTIISQTPRLLRQAVIQRRMDLVVMAADLVVVPLSLYALTCALTVFAAAGILYFGGSPSALIMTTASAALMVLGLLIAWYGFGRELVSLKELFQIPVYIARKLPMYFDLIRNPERKWVRSARKKEERDE